MRCFDCRIIASLDGIFKLNQSIMSFDLVLVHFLHSHDVHKIITSFTLGLNVIVTKFGQSITNSIINVHCIWSIWIFGNESWIIGITSHAKHTCCEFVESFETFFLRSHQFTLLLLHFFYFYFHFFDSFSFLFFFLGFDIFLEFSSVFLNLWVFWVFWTFWIFNVIIC